MAAPARPVEDPSLAEAYRSFVPVRAIGRGSRTKGNYDLAWNALLAHLARRLGRAPLISDLDAPAVDEFIETGAEERGWSEQTMKTYGGNIRSVVSGLESAGVLPRGTLVNFRTVKVAKRLPVFFGDAELAGIFEALEVCRSERNLRLRAFANLMLDNGARPEEVSRLTFRDAWRELSQIRILGKGAKERVVPVGERSWEYLADYLRVRVPPVAPDDPLFLNVRGAATGVEATTMASDMHDLLIELGLVSPGASGQEDSGYSLYTMRKTFARRAALGGMDVAELAAVMGHSPASIPMLIELYYRPSDTQLSAAHAEARPADGFHAWRAEPTRDPRPGPSLSFFHRAVSGDMARGGKSPASRPSSRSLATAA